MIFWAAILAGACLLLVGFFVGLLAGMATRG